MGAYSSNDPRGIRRYPYTTDMIIDPETYECILSSLLMKCFDSIKLSMVLTTLECMRREKYGVEYYGMSTGDS